jgi:hypothetical protein
MITIHENRLETEAAIHRHHQKQQLLGPMSALMLIETLPLEMYPVSLRLLEVVTKREAAYKHPVTRTLLRLLA